jgi:hypothetical protein
MNRKPLWLGLLGAFAPYGADEIPTGHVVMIGDHRIYTHCSGMSSKVTVVLVNGLGAGLEAWQPVESDFEGFATAGSTPQPYDQLQ